jgi:hypothetical protein
MRQRLLQTLMGVAAMSLAIAPGKAAAQSTDGWQFSVVPFYFWATELDGRISAGPVTVPVFLEFSDAADNLGGAFSFHFEAVRGRWGVLADLNFIRLSSSADFAVGPQAVPVTGDFELDNVMFEVGGLFLLNEPKRFGVIGGLRTYTLSPAISFSGPAAGATPIDASETSPNAFVGVVFRPPISDRWTFISRADIGGGDANLTWSAVAGVEYRLWSWGGIEFGYKALGIDVEGGSEDLREYDMTHYGPIFGLRLHWGQ